jgi:hypothetical protein
MNFFKYQKRRVIETNNINETIFTGVISIIGKRHIL